MQPADRSHASSRALIDLSGTVHISDKPIEGTVRAIERLRACGIPFKFLTNTTKISSSTLASQLDDMGLELASDSIITSTKAARNFLMSRSLRPLCLIEEELIDDLEGIELGDADTGANECSISNKISFTKSRYQH